MVAAVEVTVAVDAVVEDTEDPVEVDMAAEVTEEAAVAAEDSEEAVVEVEAKDRPEAVCARSIGLVRK